MLLIDLKFFFKLCARFPFATLAFLACANLAQAQFGQGYYPGMYQRARPWYWNIVHNGGDLLGTLVVGVMIGIFFSPRFKPIRKYVWFGLGGLFLMWLLVNEGYFISGMIQLAGFGLGCIAGYLAMRDKNAGRDRDTTYGSAEWANIDHLRQHNLVGDTGIFLGSYDREEQAARLQYTGNRHLLTIAPTRSGKGTAAIIPNLLTYEGSALVIDPKGENARITAMRRAQGDAERKIPGMGQAVHIVDPWGISGFRSSQFNPLDWLDPSDPDISENALMLADAIVMTHSGAKEPFWDEEAKALLMGLLLFVALVEKGGDRTLGRVRQIIASSKVVFNAVLEEMAAHDNPIISSTATRTQSKEDRLLSGVLATLQAHTHFLDSPKIQQNLARSDFRFEDLKTHKMTVYLVLPADRLQTFGRWLRLLVQQAITVNARNIMVQPEKPVLFLLDEMAAMGHLTMVEQAYGLMAGFGMQLWGIVQDLSQLEGIYGKGWETFIGNSGVLQYYGSRDHKTAEYFSKLCGVTTVLKFSFGSAIAHAISHGQNGTSTKTTTKSSNYDVVQRHLAYADELMVMRDNAELVLIEQFNPIRGRRLEWFNDPRMAGLGVNLHMEAARTAPAITA